jgi:DNA-directed RNA polymerase alpha subunit|tara:strand:+ start:320 stop:673 length:354 start_codon:yes stop_codon:yes gene_type:complete
MNLFGLGMDSKIEDVLDEIGYNIRLWNILRWRINDVRVHKTIYSCGEIPDKDKVITMRDLVNMSRENILNVRHLGNKSVDQIKSIFKYCGINDIKGWKNLDVTKRYFDSEKKRYLEK